ncbi:MAG: HepT-like ribonuclease domain-containing protein [Janthinobacterium lividum]
MKEQRSNKIRLLDIRDKAGLILRKYATLNGEHLDDDDLRYDGFVHLVSIIGEAAHKLSRELRVAHPEIPWRPIIAMRHIIVHEL